MNFSSKKNRIFGIWNIFPENPQIYQLVVEARSLKVLRVEENRSTKEKVIRYTRKMLYKREAKIIPDAIARYIAFLFPVRYKTY